MPRFRSILLAFLLLSGTVSTSSIAQAQTIHRCESYKTTGGRTSYRVVPSIPGSYGTPGLPSSTTRCFVPVTGKQCFYRPSSQKQWRPCGENFSSGGTFRINFADGDGEVVEAPDGKQYHAFSFFNVFYFD